MFFCMFSGCWGWQSLLKVLNANWSKNAKDQHHVVPTGCGGVLHRILSFGHWGCTVPEESESERVRNLSEMNQTSSLPILYNIYIIGGLVDSSMFKFSKQLLITYHQDSSYRLAVLSDSESCNTFGTTQTFQGTTRERCSTGPWQASKCWWSGTKTISALANQSLL